MKTGSPRWMAYARSTSPPAIESHQNARGTTLFFLISDATHWTRNRPVKSACPSNPTSSQPEGMVSRLTANHLVSEPAFLHPSDRQEIGGGPEHPVPHAVLAHAPAPRPVAHGNLRHAETFDAEERRQEAVHARVELEAGERLPPKRLERAAGVDDVVAGDRVPHRV